MTPIKFQEVYKSLKRVNEALNDLRDVSELKRCPNLYAVAQLVVIDLHDAAHDDGVIG